MSGAQQRGHEALGDLLQYAASAGLPDLAWTLATTGALTGDAIGLGHTAEEQRTAVELWAAYLNATVQTRTDHDGTIHLAAQFAWVRNPMVGGIIRATIFPAGGGS